MRSTWLSAAVAAGVMLAVGAGGVERAEASAIYFTGHGSGDLNAETFGVFDVSGAFNIDGSPFGTFNYSSEEIDDISGNTVMFQTKGNITGISRAVTAFGTIYSISTSYFDSRVDEFLSFDGRPLVFPTAEAPMSLGFSGTAYIGPSLVPLPPSFALFSSAILATGLGLFVRRNWRRQVA